MFRGKKVSQKQFVLLEKTNVRLHTHLQTFNETELFTNTTLLVLFCAETPRYHLLTFKKET